MTTNEMNKRPVCEHCRGTEYVLAYWLEKMLEQHGVHMTDIPPDIFQMIPVQYIQDCHCNVRLLLFKNRRSRIDCSDCDGTTWRFSEAGEEAGYRWRKVSELSVEEIKALPSSYFERCPCGYDEQGPKHPERKKTLKEILDLLKVKVPGFGFSFCHE